MDEVRSYWQVASINHFCTLFSKQFKLPELEPEELEQAFILEIDSPSKSNTNRPKIETKSEQEGRSKEVEDFEGEDRVNQKIENGEQIKPNEVDQKEEEQVKVEGVKQSDEDTDCDETKSEHSKAVQPTRIDRYNQDEDYIPNDIDGHDNKNVRFNDEDHDEDEDEDEDDVEEEEEQKSTNRRSNNNSKQIDTNIKNPKLVNLAISLLEPHFNTRLNYRNWENYLHRIIDLNWVELEQYPNPLLRQLVSTDGEESFEELTFNELSIGDKIDVIHALCDYRLWCEDVQNKLKDFPLEELRLESIGKDTQGYEYWYFSGTRLYRENKELAQDITSRKKRIIELETKLVELERSKRIKEIEEKKKAELEKARQLAAEAREAKRKQQEEESRSKRKQATPILPLRSGLRERRSSTASNKNQPNNHTDSKSNSKNDCAQEEVRRPTTRSKVAKEQQNQDQLDESNEPQPTNTRAKSTRNSTARESRGTGKKTEPKKAPTPNIPKKSPEEECREELEKILIKSEERKDAWKIECESLEEWEQFATKYEGTKSTNERYLMNNINEIILPKIRAIYAKRAAEARRKEKELIYSLANRRVSTRLVSKRNQEEEEEKHAQIHESEMRRKKAEAEDRLRAELEREMRIRKNRFVTIETSSNYSDELEENSNSRYNLRQNQEYLDLNEDEFGGIIHPDKLAEFYEALELIIDSVRTSKHAWPFVDPVSDSVPGYYDLIEEPMDLRKLRTKIEFREYKSLIELEKDFQLIVNNCERFNGPKNVYTKMAYKLWKSFRKNVRLYLQRDLCMDENATFFYPPPPPPGPPKKEDQQTTNSATNHDGEQQQQQNIHNNMSNGDSHNHINNHEQQNGDCLIKQDVVEESKIPASDIIETKLSDSPNEDCKAPTPEALDSPKPPTPERISPARELSESLPEMTSNSSLTVVPATLKDQPDIQTNNLLTPNRDTQQQQQQPQQQHNHNHEPQQQSLETQPVQLDQQQQQQQLQQQPLDSCIMKYESPSEDIIIDSYDMTLTDENFYLLD